MTMLSALVAPFHAIWREIRGVFASPIAFFGGLTGMLVMCGALLAFFLYAPDAAAEAEDLWAIDFTLGALVTIRKEISEDEKVITEETVARDEPEEPVEEVPDEPEEEAVQEEVTKQDTKPIEKKKEPTKITPKKITPKKATDKPEDKPPDTKVADKNT